MAHIDLGSNIPSIVRDTIFTLDLYTRAAKSALSSVGFGIKKQLERQIKSQGAKFGAKWDDLHPLTKDGDANKRPYENLIKFTRYRKDDDGLRVHVLLARDAKGDFGETDPVLEEFLRRAENGEIRRKTKKVKGWRAVMGYPMKARTQYVRVPPRPIIGPVAEKVEKDIVGMFVEKYKKNLERYTRGL